jgi:hypothetical protein
MLELGSSGSVRGVLSNEHPYREPRPTSDVRSITAHAGRRIGLVADAAIQARVLMAKMAGKDGGVDC